MPSLALISSTTLKKSAFSRSILLTKMRRGSLRLFAITPDHLGADFHAGGGADDDYRAFADAHAGFDLADEVGIAGGIDDIYFLVPPVEGQQGQVDADSALDFIRVIVGDGGPVINFAQAGDNAGGEKHRLGERSLTGTSVG